MRKEWMVVALMLALAVPSGPRAAMAQPADPAPGVDDATPAAAEAEAEAGSEAASEAEAPEPEPDPAAERLNEARERIGTGETLFSEGNYDAALAEFQRAGELLSDHPMHFLVLYNIGKCYEQLFRYGDAMEYYRRYLEEGGADQPDAGEVRAKIDLLQSLLGVIQLSVNVPDYEVWVDGRRVGQNVTTIMVPGGSHRVEVRADGYVQETQETQLTARGEESLTFELEALAEEYEGLSPVLFWSSAGIGAAALVGGVALAGTARSRRNAIDAAANSGDMSREIRAATVDAQDEIKKLSISADVLFGTALLFGAAAVGLAFATDWGGDESRW